MDHALAATFQTRLSGTLNPYPRPKAEVRELDPPMSEGGYLWLLVVRFSD